MTAHQIHPDPSVRALIERERRAAAAEALTLAADAALTMFDPPINECIDWSEWLRDRADRLAETATGDPA